MRPFTWEFSNFFKFNDLPIPGGCKQSNSNLSKRNESLIISCIVNMSIYGNFKNGQFHMNLSHRFVSELYVLR